jgi:hypothetical protein
VEGSGCILFRVLSGNFLGGLSKTTKNLCQESRCHRRDFISVPPEYHLSFGETGVVFANLVKNIYIFHYFFLLRIFFIQFNLFLLFVRGACRRSWWARGLRHEPSSFARTLGSWVQIPLKACMSVYAVILCLYCLVCR